MSWDEMVDARQSVEDLIGLDAFYEIEEQTVEEEMGKSKAVLHLAVMRDTLFKRAK